MTIYSATETSLNVSTTAVTAVPNLSLSGPATVAEDQAFDVYGVLNGGATKGFVPLPGQPIDILVDGTKVTTVTTALQGSEAVYIASIIIPSPGSHIIKARFNGATIAD